MGKYKKHPKKGNLTKAVAPSAIGVRLPVNQVQELKTRCENVGYCWRYNQSCGCAKILACTFKHADIETHEVHPKWTGPGAKKRPRNQAPYDDSARYAGSFQNRYASQAGAMGGEMSYSGDADFCPIEDYGRPRTRMLSDIQGTVPKPDFSYLSKPTYKRPKIDQYLTSVGQLEEALKRAKAKEANEAKMKAAMEKESKSELSDRHERSQFIGHNREDWYKHRYADVIPGTMGFYRGQIPNHGQILWDRIRIMEQSQFRIYQHPRYRDNFTCNRCRISLPYVGKVETKWCHRCMAAPYCSMKCFNAHREYHTFQCYLHPMWKLSRDEAAIVPADDELDLELNIDINSEGRHYLQKSDVYARIFRMTKSMTPQRKSMTLKFQDPKSMTLRF